MENGDFRGPVTNAGTIEDGTFHGKVENGGTITGGSFQGNVNNRSFGHINGGTFEGRVTNNGGAMDEDAMQGGWRDHQSGAPAPAPAPVLRSSARSSAGFAAAERKELWKRRSCVTSSANQSSGR